MTKPSALRRIRDERGWSRERVASAANVSLMTVVRMEQGSYPRVENLISIADCLGVTLDDLVGRPARKARNRRRQAGSAP